MKMSPRFKFWFKLCISTGFVGYLIFAISWKDVWESLRNAHFGWIGMGYLLMFGILYLQAWRWKCLLHIPGLPISKYLHFIFVGVFYRLILPGSLSSEMLKVILFGKKYDKPFHESSLVFFSQFLGLGIQWIVGIVGFIYFRGPVLEVWQKAQLSWSKLIFLGLAMACGAAAIFLVPTFRATFVKMLKSMKTAIRTPGLVGKVFLLTVGIQILMIGASYCIFWGVQIKIPLLFLCFQMAIINTLILLPISINGIGVVEYLNLFLLHTTMGYTAPKIIAVSAVSYSLQVINGMIGGGWILWRNAATSKIPNG